MKSILVCLLLTSFMVTVQAQEDKTIYELEKGKAKQSSEDFVPAPSRIYTDFGTLEFKGGGYPTPETIEKVQYQMDLQRAGR